MKLNIEEINSCHECPFKLEYVRCAKLKEESEKDEFRKWYYESQKKW